MPWFLRVQEGERFRDAAVLAEGQPLIIGRAETADLPFPQDHQMSSRHLSVELKAGVCRFQDLQSTNGSWLNDEPLLEGELPPGALLKCGMTVFCVEVDAQSGNPTAPVLASSTEGAAAKPAGGPSKPIYTSTLVAAPAEELPADLQQIQGFVADTAAEIVELFQLQKLITVIPDGQESPVNFAKRLLSAEDENASLNFLAYALPKRLSVWWALQCLQSEEGLTSKPDTAILPLIADWVRQPTDALRRQAMAAAEAVEMQTPASWAGVAVFWSHGSLSPAGQPEIPPQPQLCGKAVAAATMLGAVVKTPEEAPERRRRFVHLADEIAAGEHSWE